MENLLQGYCHKRAQESTQASTGYAEKILEILNREKLNGINLIYAHRNKKEKLNRGDPTFPYLVSIMKKLIQQIKTYMFLFDFRSAKLQSIFDSAMINLKNFQKKFHDIPIPMQNPAVRQLVPRDL